MKMTTDVMFNQMSANVGIKYFEEHGIADMLNEFKQLIDGSMPGKIVFGITNPDGLTPIENRGALE